MKKSIFQQKNQDPQVPIAIKEFNSKYKVGDKVMARSPLYKLTGSQIEVKILRLPDPEDTPFVRVLYPSGKIDNRHFSLVG